MATHVTAAERAAVADQTDAKPYEPSWLDAIIDRLERLPGPTWLAYMGLAALAVAFIAFEAALSSRGLFGQDPAYFAYAFFQVYPLAAYYYLSRGAVAAWDAFRPATDLGDAHAARLRYELSTTPARPAALAWLFGALMYGALLLVAPEGFDLVAQPPEFVALRALSESLWMAPIALMVTYLLFRQLRIVSRLHRSISNVDLLRPGPLHAMSTLTARSAVVLIILVSSVGLPWPNLSEGVRLTVFVLALPTLGLAVAAFFVPLRGMQARLAAEKDRRMTEVNARIDAAAATLHTVVDEETSSDRDPESSRLAQTRIDALNKALTTLFQERDFIRRLSTMPWDTTTLRAVASAIVLPIALFLLTRVLERFIL